MRAKGHDKAAGLGDVLGDNALVKLQRTVASLLFGVSTTDLATFIAVPLLATFKIFCDHIETLAPIGEFLGK